MTDNKPRVDVRHVSLVKDGHAPGDNEDAADVQAKTWPVRVAVADGATESAFAGRWAKGVVEACLTRGVDTADDLRAVLPRVQQKWQADVAQRVHDRPWYVAAKAADGAFATCLAASLRADGTWCAVAVGDSVLLHLREDALVQAWPLDDPAAFDTRPALLPSRERYPVPSIEATTGSWQPGDTLIVATDAVGQWLLRTGPAGRLAGDETAMRSALKAARADGSLRNDDSTVVWLDIMGVER